MSQGSFGPGGGAVGSGVMFQQAVPSMVQWLATFGSRCDRLSNAVEGDQHQREVKRLDDPVASLNKRPQIEQGPGLRQPPGSGGTVGVCASWKWRAAKSTLGYETSRSRWLRDRKTEATASK